MAKPEMETKSSSFIFLDNRSLPGLTTSMAFEGNSEGKHTKQG